MQDDISDKPDFHFIYECMKIGLESTCCYPPNAMKAKKDQNKYEIGYKGVRQNWDSVALRYLEEQKKLVR